MSKVKELDVDVFQLTPLDYKENNQCRLVHYRPVDEAFKWSIDKALANKSDKVRFNSNSRLDDILECHVLFGGDHGQGTFRVVVTVLLISRLANKEGCPLTLEVDQLCGYVECKKDTREVLANTVATPLNESLKRLGNKLNFVEDESGKRTVKWGNLPKEESDAEEESDAVTCRDAVSVVHSVPVTKFLVGNQAFQLSLQCKEGNTVPHTGATVACGVRGLEMS